MRRSTGANKFVFNRRVPMHKQNPILTLHEALSAATLRDLANEHYDVTDWNAALELQKTISAEEYQEHQRKRTLPTKSMTRRPDASEVDVVLFPQLWGSTALGYGGLGGAAMSWAYTVIAMTGAEACVYFGGGHLAYRVQFAKMTNQQRKAWDTALAQHDMPSCQNALVEFGVIGG